MRVLHLAMAVTAVTVLAAAPFDPDPSSRPLAREAGPGFEELSEAAPPARPDLVLTAWSCVREDGDIAVQGRVRNRGRRLLTSVIAVGVFQAENGALVRSDRALLTHSALLPGQASGFEVRTRDDPSIASCAIDFGHLMGGSLAFVEEAGMADLAGVGPADIRALQRHLIDLGYDPGQPDGMIGPKTRDAILAFQQDQDLPPTGLITAELMALLPEG